MISYGGVFTSDFRNVLQKEWLVVIKEKGI
jgi:hypothetical protein